MIPDRVDTQSGGNWLYPKALSYHQGYGFRVDPNNGHVQSLTRGQAISGLRGDYREIYNQGFTLTPILLGFAVGALVAYFFAPLPEDEDDEETRKR